MRFEGDRLLVNLHAPRGALRAELQDATGHAIEGFSLADAVPTRGDGLDLAVKWRNGELRALSGKPVRVRFELTDGSLYSFRFAKQS